MAGYHAARRICLSTTLLLATAGTAGAASPSQSFYGSVTTPRGVTTVIGPTASTLALTSLSFDNFYDQINGASTGVSLWATISSAANCTGNVSGFLIGRFQARAGETQHLTFAAPALMQPRVPGQYLCLTANVLGPTGASALAAPMVNYSGYVVSGSAP